MVKSGRLLVVVTSVATLFVVFNSPPPETVTVFAMGDGALVATFTISVMTGKAALATRASERVQVRVAIAQFHPVPARAVAVKPEGSVSLTLTTPDVGAVPEFDTVI